MTDMCFSRCAEDSDVGHITELLTQELISPKTREKSLKQRNSLLQALADTKCFFGFRIWEDKSTEKKNKEVLHNK